MGSVPSQKSLIIMSTLCRKFWTGKLCNGFCPNFVLSYFLLFSWKSSIKLVSTVRKMLKCVYMMLPGIHTSVFVVTLMKKYPPSWPVCLVSYQFNQIIIFSQKIRIMKGYNFIHLRKSYMQHLKVLVTLLKLKLLWIKFQKGQRVMHLLDTPHRRLQVQH